MLFGETDKCKDNLKKYIGGKVVGIRCLGDAVFLRREYIEAAVYNRLENLPEDDRNYWSKFENIPDDFQLVRHTVVEKDIIFDFENGESLSIFFPEEEKAEIKKIDDKDSGDINFRPEKLYFLCVGKTISGIDIEKSDKGIAKIKFIFDNGVQMHFYGLLGFCAVSLISRKGVVSSISFGELKSCLK